MTRLVVDSTCDLPEQVMKDMNIVMVPLKVHFGTEQFRDKVELDNAAFFNRLEQAEQKSEMPTTSQPSPGEFAEAYRQLPEGEAIISIHIAEQLSGTLQSARLAAQELKDRDIRVIDSGNVTAAAGLLVLAAAEMLRQGKSADEVEKSLLELRTRTRMVAILETPKYAVLGGRVSRLQGAVGGFLRVKPMFAIDHGEVVRMAPARTWGQAIQAAIKDVQQHGGPEALSVVDARNPEAAAALRQEVEKAFPGVPLSGGEIGAVIGTHGGPGAIALAYIAKPAS